MPVHHSLPEPISFDRPRSWIFSDLPTQPCFVFPLLHIRTSISSSATIARTIFIYDIPGDLALLGWFSATWFFLSLPSRERATL